MKIYNSVTIDIETGEILAEDSFEYSGPLALCGGDGGGDGGGGGDSGGGEGDADGVGGIGGPGDSGGSGIGASGEGGVGVGASGSGSVGDSGGFGIGASGSGGIGAGGSASGSVGGGGSTGVGFGPEGSAFGLGEVFGAPAEAFGGIFGADSTGSEVGSDATLAQLSEMDALMALAQLANLGRTVEASEPEPNPMTWAYKAIPTLTPEGKVMLSNHPTDPVTQTEIAPTLEALANAMTAARNYSLDRQSMINNTAMLPSYVNLGLTTLATAPNVIGQMQGKSNPKGITDILGIPNPLTAAVTALANLGLMPETITPEEEASWWSPEGNFVGYQSPEVPSFTQGESENDNTPSFSVGFPSGYNPGDFSLGNMAMDSMEAPQTSDEEGFLSSVLGYIAGVLGTGQENMGNNSNNAWGP